MDLATENLGILSNLKLIDNKYFLSLRQGILLLTKHLLRSDPIPESILVLNEGLLVKVLCLDLSTVLKQPEQVLVHYGVQARLFITEVAQVVLGHPP